MEMKEVEKHFGAKELLDALETQVRVGLAEGKHRNIGKILYDMELLTFLQIEQVIASLNSDSISRHSQSDNVGDGWRQV